MIEIRRILVPIDFSPNATSVLEWAAHLAKVPVPGVARDVGWRLAIVTRSDGDGAAIGFSNGEAGRVPFSEMRWARPWHGADHFGPYPRSTADVV